MPTTRQGLNTTLSYKQKGVRHAYQVRANLITHGMKVLFDESASRTRRAFYPHRLTSAQFVLGIQLIGDDEYRSFSSWMATYADFILDLDLALGEFPSMVVSVPSQNFLRTGVPLSGFEWGDHVGAMVWTPQVVFESASEPLDTGPVNLSMVEGLDEAGKRDGALLYFYPSGKQLTGNELPADGTYTKQVTMADLIAAGANETEGDEVISSATTTTPPPEQYGPPSQVGPGNWNVDNPLNQ